MDAWTFIGHSNETTLPIKVSLEEMMSRLRNLTDCKLGQFNSSKKTCNVSELIFFDVKMGSLDYAFCDQP